MKKTLTTSFLVFAVILAGIFWLIKRENRTNSQPPEFLSAAKEVQINGKKLSVEIAATPEKRALGLSGRESLCPDCAMLFIFEKPGAYSFWMKDMQFNLDIIWISGNEIVGISKNVSYERGTSEVVSPPAPVDKVLEINAGTSASLNLKAGDKVEF
jgi:uncharacterized protein